MSEQQAQPPVPDSPTGAAPQAAALGVGVGSAALHAAVSLFTWVPVPAVDLDRDTARRALLALPWVGLACGLAAGTVAAVVGLLGGGPLLAAVAGLAALALLTGAMHLDGLADTADGLGSRKPTDQALAVMKASDIGPMGVAALVFVLAFDAAALTSPHLAGAALPAAVVAMPMVGRVAALIGTGRWSAPARPTGFGALFAGVTTDLALLISGVAVLAAAALGGGLALGARGVAVFMLGALVAWGVAALWQRHLHRRFGGITGDTLGALIEVSQAAFLLSLALFL